MSKANRAAAADRPFQLELQALERMASARDILDHLLGGHEVICSETVGHLAHMLQHCSRRLGIAEALRRLEQ